MSGGAFFSPAALMAEASGRTGLSDFGDPGFHEPLAVVCRSLEEEAPLTPGGRAAQREALIGKLTSRLLLQEWVRRHPDILDEEIAPPVVIAGLPRTGTTMLYRMLAADPGLAAPLYYEVTALAPAFDWDFDPAGDPRRAAARTRIDAMMAAMPDLGSIYPFEPEAPEESIFLYGPSFVSTSEPSSALVPAYSAWFADADKTPAYRYLRLTLQFLQWQRRRSGQPIAGRRWLLKTPDHLHGLDALLAIFPEARIIQTHRDPLRTIPSICSFIRVLHSTSTARDDSGDIGRAWSAMFARSLTRATDVRAYRPDAFLDVWYRDTVAWPLAVAEAVFAFLGLPLTPEGEAEMARWREANRREARPEHHYTLDQFDLTEDQIRADFRAYRERFIEPYDASSAT